MSLKIETYSLTGKNHVNQDIADSILDAFWVFDGATPLFGDDYLGGNDVQKTMEAISEALKQMYDGNRSLQDNLLHAVKAIDQIYLGEVPGYDQLPYYAKPTFAAALGRIRPGKLEYYVIGDCALRTPDGKLIRDASFDRINERNKKKVAALKAKLWSVSVLSDEDAEMLRRESLQVYQETRKLLNHADTNPEGYWIASLDGTGIPHGVSGDAEISEGPVYAMSDGMIHILERMPGLLEHSPDPGKRDFRSNVSAFGPNYTDDDATILMASES